MAPRAYPCVRAPFQGRIDDKDVRVGVALSVREQVAHNLAVGVQIVPSIIERGAVQHGQEILLE